MSSVCPRVPGFFSFTNANALIGLEALVMIFIPATLYDFSTASTVLTILSTLSTTFLVRSKEAPAGMFNEYKKMLWSSVGIKPVGVLFTIITVAIVMTTSPVKATHFVLIKNRRLRLYRLVRFSKPALKP